MIANPAWLAPASVLFAVSCQSTPPPTLEGRVEVGDSFLHFDQTGEGPAIVFVHGGQMDSRMWDEQVRSFSKDHRVLRFDVRGYGRSGGIKNAYASHDDLDTFVETLGLPAFTLVGLSLGGRIAIDYALDHADRLNALVLVAPGLTGWEWSGPDHAFFDDIVTAAQAGNTARAVELWLECPYMTPAMELAHLAPRLRQLATDNERAWTIPPIEVRRTPPAVTELDRLTVPTLLVVGDRDVPDILRIADRLERDCPKLRRVDFIGVGHLPNLEQPERFDTELRDFLEQVAVR